MTEGRALRVAIATRFPRDPASPRGGVEAVSVNLVRALARLDGLDVCVVTDDPDVSTPTEDDVGGVTVHRLPRGRGPLLWEASGPGRRRMSRFLQELAPDLVHSHDVYGLMVQDVPTVRVFTVHGFIHADTRLSGQRLPWLRSWLWRFFELRGWSRQHHVIAISPYVRERLAGHVRGRVHDIENPVDERCFQVARNEEPSTLFSAALVERRKNTLALVEAVGMLREKGVDTRLRLAGAVREPDYGQLVAARIRELGLGDRIQLLGPLPGSAVREELRAAAVFVLASLEENAPMGIAEAMAAGVPVVASDRCGMPYMISESETGFLVDPRDPEELASRLAELLTSPGLRRSLGHRAQETARSRFSPDIVARRTREVYRRAVARARTRGDRGETQRI